MLNDTLEITTKIGCVNNCSYCPQENLIKAYEGNIFMSFDQFYRILLNTPKTVQIDFTGFCEPFLNPQAAYMMKYASHWDWEVVTLTTLMGITDEDIDILRGVKFKKFGIHEYDGNKAESSLISKLRDAVATDDFEVFAIDDEHTWSRAGNLWERETIKGKIECGWTGKRFRRNVVLPNGDVYICCMDYSLKHKIGNLLEQHYNDLDRDKLVDLCDQEDSDLLCRKCEIVKKR